MKKNTVVAHLVGDPPSEEGIESRAWNHWGFVLHILLKDSKIIDLHTLRALLDNIAFLHPNGCCTGGEKEKILQKRGGIRARCAVLIDSLGEVEG